MRELRAVRPEETAHAWEQIKRHNNILDCWVVLSGRVYDVTAFLHQHPGGVMALGQPGRAGCDVTRHFERVGHSDVARQRLQELCVGTVAPMECHEEVTFNSTLPELPTECSP